MRQRLLVLTILLVTASVVTAQVGPFRPLTPELLKEALAEGQTTKTPPLDILIERMSRSEAIDAKGQATDLSGLLAAAERAPFSVTIITPYRRVLTEAAEAKRRFAEPPALSVDTLNAEGVVLLVGAGTNFLRADVIEDVVIKKDEKIIRPTSKKVTPTEIKNRMGNARQSADGEFRFAFDVMPAAPFTIVCIGAGGNYELTVVNSDLDRMK